MGSVTLNSPRLAVPGLYLPGAGELGSPKNSVGDGNFDNIPAIWTLSPDGGTVEQSTTQAKYGTSSMRLVASAQVVYAYQNILLPVGHKFYVAAWCWLASGSLTTTGLYMSIMDWVGTTTSANKTLANGSLGANWQKRSAVATVGSGYTGLRIVCGRTSNQTAEYFIDGILGVHLDRCLPKSKLNLPEADLKTYCDTRFPEYF